MAQFEVQPVNRFSGSNSAIKRPVEIACFSYDDKHDLHIDDSSLKYYYPPKLGVSLSVGFEKFDKLSEQKDEHLDGLLAAIIDLEKKTNEQLNVDVITWRGMMTKILTSPYAGNFDGFEMNATNFQNTIFIEENRAYKLASAEKQRLQPTRPYQASQDLMSYWGYKFETLSLLPNTWDATSREYIEGRDVQIVSNHAQYCSVVRTGFGSTKLVLGGEIDGVWDEKASNPSTDATNWVELKTSAEILSSNDALKFERKLHKFWAQSFLLGVPKIIVGFRSNDNEARLLRLQEIETRKIPGIVKRGGKAIWDGNVCVNFASAWLEFLRSTIQGEGGVWRIRRRDRSNVIEIIKLEDSGYGDILSQGFLNWRRRKQ